MSQPIGITFAPTETSDLAKKPAPPGSPEAVQILSLHLPKFAGARPLAPTDLLTAQPSSAGSAVVDSILQQMGLMPPTAQPSMGGPTESGSLADLLRRVTGGAGSRYEPTPNVSPGLDTAAPTSAPTAQRPWNDPTGDVPLRAVNPTGMSPRASYQDQFERPWMGGRR